MGVDEALCVEGTVMPRANSKGCYAGSRECQNAGNRNGDPRAAVLISTVEPVPVSLASTELGAVPNEHECALECGDMR